jgi:hypothetical protein
MNNNMTLNKKNKTIDTSGNTDSTRRLRSIIEQSIAVLSDRNDSSAGPAKRLRRRFLPIHADSINLQKCALTAAANALAALWKVPESGRSKNQHGLQFSR